MKSKNTTNEQLARMVQEGFTESKSYMDERFGQVDKQFAEVHHQLKAIRKELLGVVYRHEFEDLQGRVKELEDMLAMPHKKAA